MANVKRDTVKINDKEYKLADLSNEAKAQLTICMCVMLKYSVLRLN